MPMPPEASPATPAVRRRRVWPLAVLAAALGTTGCATWRVDRVAPVATGFTSHLLCDEVFTSGLDPDRAFDERIRPLPGMGPVAWALTRTVDRERREVRVSLAGAYESRAGWRAGRGCLALPAAEPVADLGPPAAPVDSPAPDEPPPVEAVDPRLRTALEHAIPPGAARPTTRAVVVWRDGRPLAERYAPGIGPATPLLGFSASKSVMNGLIGILVRQGRLRLDGPAPLPAWRDPADPRHAITVEQLLRQTSGLDLPQDNSGADLNARVMYTARDKAAEAARVPLAAPPGRRWAYTDGHYLLLSRLLRDAVGGDAAAVHRFAHEELFAPLGMRQVTIDVDATGTPVGAAHLLASARDWARFGQFCLDDGVVDGRRLLPEGWMRMSTTPTLATGYGAGFWTNRVPGLVPGWGVPWGLSRAPADTFFARGFMGQYVVVIPSERLVLVRLGASHERGDDIAGTDRLVGEVLEALRPAR